MTEHEAPFLSRLTKTLPWLVLAVLALFTYARIFQAPYFGFRYSTTGEIIELYVSDPSLQIGDKLEQIGPVSWAEFEANPLQTWPDGERPGTVIQLQVKREGQVQTIPWELPGITSEEFIQRINGEWWLPYVFWLAGTATLFLVRPRDTVWKLLVAFNYLTALWLAAGGVSRSHLWGSVFVLTAAVWLSAAVYLHLHWLFPRPLSRPPAVLVVAGYLLVVALVGADWLQLLPRGAYQAGFILAIVASLLLLLFRFVWRPAQRHDIALLGAALLLALAPVITVVVVGLFAISLPAILRGGAILALPAIPGAYFYSVYRRQLGHLGPQAERLSRLYLISILLTTAFIVVFSVLFTRSEPLNTTLVVGVAATIMVAALAVIALAPFLFLPALAGARGARAANEVGSLEFRANRLVTPYLFTVLIVAGLAIVAIFSFTWLEFPGEAVVITVVATVLAVAISVTGYRPFRRFVDRYLLGLPLPPSGLLETYAAQIVTSFDRDSLAHLLRGQVLPSLLIREAAILLINDSDGVEVFCVLGLEPDDLPTSSGLSALIDQIREQRLSYPSGVVWQPYPWVRLAVSLDFGGESAGLWLLGRRDPDDLYGRDELPLFQALADQTAIALANIRLTENLQALYREDIDRQEAERARLARTLHDEVLNRLAVLAMLSDERADPQRFQEAYGALTSQVRQTISGLRPAMLQYGLRTALEELVDELTVRVGDSPLITLDLPPSEVRYPEKVEQHLFRIVQQAAENALRHAQAQTIRIDGGLVPGHARLTVNDDGVGFAADQQTDLVALLADRHFGLAGMHERAALIGARLAFNTAPGDGTRVLVIWQEASADHLPVE